jgi:hypothetical protein
MYYKTETNNPLALRSRFKDSVMFIGWYINKTNKINKIPFNDAYRQYLNYYLGWGNYSKKVYKTDKNAIIYAKNLQTTGIGAGQMSRIDSTNIATQKAINSARVAQLKEPMTIGSVVASDAFFPFPDGLISTADAGITAVIQPGGSIKDKEVIAAADERNIAMVFTSIRHFKH